MPNMSQACRMVVPGSTSNLLSSINTSTCEGGVFLAAVVVLRRRCRSAEGQIILINAHRRRNCIKGDNYGESFEVSPVDLIQLEDLLVTQRNIAKVELFLFAEKQTVQS